MRGGVGRPSYLHGSPLGFSIDPGEEKREMGSDSEEMLESAKRYARLGWSVIPIQARGKRPLVPWLEFQQRTASVSEIDAWYRRWPDANVGIVTGRISGLVVVDIDPAHGGSDSLEAIAHEHGPLLPEIEVATGGGGRHFYFHHSGVAVPNRVGLYPGIDVRGDGGCVVAPPSIHPSGGRYRWVPARGPGEGGLPELPAWAIRMLTGEHKRGRPLRHWRSLVRKDVEEGRRNSTIASLAGHLLWHGVDADIVLELMFTWNRARCRPPLADQEVAGIVDSIAGLHASGQDDTLSANHRHREGTGPRQQ